jgi:hypothetical protein
MLHWAPPRHYWVSQNVTHRGNHVIGLHVTIDRIDRVTDTPVNFLRNAAMMAERVKPRSYSSSGGMCTSEDLMYRVASCRTKLSADPSE